MPGGAAATTPFREKSRQLSSKMTGSVEDHFTQTSISLGRAVYVALEVVREKKSLRMAGRWWQWLEDAWVRYDAAYTLYASKLKEASQEVEAYWVWGRKDYKGAREPLEEYIMALQVKLVASESAEKVRAARELVAAFTNEMIRVEESCYCRSAQQPAWSGACLLNEEAVSLQCVSDPCAINYSCQ